MYESVSQKLLDEYKLESILDSFHKSSTDLKAKIGLGRYLFSWDFRKEIKKNREKLNTELLNILSEAFSTINDSNGIEKIEKIKNS